MFGEVALDGSGAAQKSFTSHYTTHDDMQAVLDFPFQDAARTSPRAAGATTALARLLRQRRLVHRRRLERLRAADLPGQPRHGPDRQLRDAGQPRRLRGRAVAPGRARPRAHVLLPRQPGRLLRRRAGLHRCQRRRPERPADDVRQPQVPDYQDPVSNNQIGTDATPAQDNFVTKQSAVRADPVAGRRSPGPPGAARRRPAGPRYASDGPGVMAFSRMDRTQQRRVRRGAEQQRRHDADGGGADLRRQPHLPALVDPGQRARLVALGLDRAVTVRSRRCT